MAQGNRPDSELLFADFEFTTRSTLPFVLSALQPLRERGYLTTFASNGTFTLGPLVVVGTGAMMSYRSKREIRD